MIFNVDSCSSYTFASFVRLLLVCLFRGKTIGKLFIIFLMTPLLSVASHAKEDAGIPDVLRVCADPYLLPFSNQEGEGYENKIAELFAKKMGVELEYTWFTQSMGFIRNTLKSTEGSASGNTYRCDLVMTVPSAFELAATTEPYYTTYYMLVYVKGRGLDDITNPQMLNEEYVEKNNPEFKFGLSDKGPAQLWVFYQGLMSYMVPYQGQPGNPKVHPGKVLIDDLIDGKFDATIIWGPTAGYYKKLYKDKADLVLLPLTKKNKENAEAKYEYSMSMAVRYGEKAWKDKINQLIQENRAEINQILLDYGIPIVE